MGANSDAIVALATSAVAPIESELRQRLGVAPDDRDVVAIETALLKAFLQGMQAANAETTETAIDQHANTPGYGGELLGGPADLELQVPQVDPWAERYGA